MQINHQWVLHILTRATIYLMLLSMVACASLYDEDVSQISSYKLPSHIESNFDISGRFIVKHRDKTSYGNFEWILQNGHETISFNTPLGQSVAKVIIDDNSDSVTLITKKQVYNSNDVDNLLKNQLGLMLPLKYLHYWIQGISVPHVVFHRVFDGFSQFGYKVEYLRWLDSNHPRLIRCTTQDTLIKIVIQ